jgi:hypothetical protein
MEVPLIARLGVVMTTLCVVAGVVLLHYAVLLRCTRVLPSLSRHRPRRVLLLIGVVLVAHFCEIWLFALGYYALAPFEPFGSVSGPSAALTMLDYVYFSAAVYSTVGFGDLVPVGPLRFMAGIEAVTGLVMIAWSASFTFLQMQQDWPQPED